MAAHRSWPGSTTGDDLVTTTLIRAVDVVAPRLRPRNSGMRMTSVYPPATARNPTMAMGLLGLTLLHPRTVRCPNR
jgi:hypothetical protein